MFSCSAHLHQLCTAAEACCQQAVNATCYPRPQKGLWQQIRLLGLRVCTSAVYSKLKSPQVHRCAAQVHHCLMSYARTGFLPAAAHNILSLNNKTQMQTEDLQQRRQRAKVVSDHPVADQPPQRHAFS